MSLYFSYPIKDNYKDSQEYNVTSADIETVQLIAGAAAQNYVVLANQMLGAAAIREAGFKHYYNSNFYYSLPNGTKNNLYQFYEKMVFVEPRREFVEQAMELTGVNDLYFVVADYWSNSKNIIAETKQIADDWYITDNGANHIFYFAK